MTINNFRELANCELEGRVRQYMWRKTPSQATAQGTWFDMSMSPGTPPPKYWFDAPPAVAKAISQSADGGFYHGPNVSPQTKYLRKFSISSSAGTALPIRGLICDYLLYYPSLDDSVLDPQTMDNSVTLPRYTSGEGVQILAVSVAARTGGQQFYVTYTNSDGVSGRVSSTVTQSNQAAIGIIVSSGSTARSGNPFIGLQDGDKGVRSIESVTMLGADVGLFALILVKPIAEISIAEIQTFTEKDFLLNNNTLPVIQDNAFLSMLFNTQNTISAYVFFGDLKVIWN